MKKMSRPLGGGGEFFLLTLYITFRQLSV